MTRCAYRLVRLEHAANAFSGEGARLYGGRWNSPGVAVVYAAESLSLAQLEMLVRLNSRKVLESQFCSVTVVFPARLVLTVDRAVPLPDNWAAPMSGAATQQLGDRWVELRESAVLAVPSALTAGERNFVFNPAHPDFPAIQVGPARSFRFDSRFAIGATQP